MDEQEQTDEQIIEYLYSLKQKREEIEAGIYCNDWIVDGILYYYAKQCKFENIVADFQMQKYDRGNISDEDISEILMTLLDLAIREEKKVQKML